MVRKLNSQAPWMDGNAMIELIGYFFNFFFSFMLPKSKLLQCWPFGYNECIELIFEFQSLLPSFLNPFIAQYVHHWHNIVHAFIILLVIVFSYCFLFVCWLLLVAVFVILLSQSKIHPHPMGATKKKAGSIWYIWFAYATFFIRWSACYFAIFHPAINKGRPYNVNHVTRNEYMEYRDELLFEMDTLGLHHMSVWDYMCCALSISLLLSTMSFGRIFSAIQSLDESSVMAIFLQNMHKNRVFCCFLFVFFVNQQSRLYGNQCDNKNKATKST